MRGFMRQSVQAYKDMCEDPDMKLRKVATPFLVSSIPPDIEVAAVDGGNPTITNEDDDSEPRGALAKVASSVLMKLLYGARVARWDLLKAVTRLAGRVSRWTRQSDAELHRLICYVDSTIELVLWGWVGDAGDAVDLFLYADADCRGSPQLQVHVGHCDVRRG